MLSYDRENYYAPEIPDAWLTVSKATVAVPDVIPLVYNKTYQTLPVSDTQLYRVIYEPQIRSGIYKAYLELKDSANYRFEEDINYIEYRILPRAVTLRILEDGKSYTVEHGEVMVGDDLLLSYYTEDGQIKAVSANPDYIVTVIPIKADGGIWLLLLLILLCILAALLIYIVFRHRESLEAVFVGFKARLAGVAEYNAAINSKEESGVRLEGIMRSVDEAHANGLITDNLAKTLLSKSGEVVKTSGSRRAIVNIEAISKGFSEGETVDINSMKQKEIISKDAVYVKVLGGGVIDKALTVKANAFSLSAVKMIALTGGKAVRVRSIKNKDADFDKNIEK
jgi:ribosomal protein L18E